MWTPTHAQVTVQRATGLLTKGKHNTNDCFVTIALGKTKYQTSVKDKSSSTVEWHEECELVIPDREVASDIILTAFHHNFLRGDEFLGRVCIPLNSLDIYERPKNRVYPLQSKSEKKDGKKKDRGQLEVKIGFTVKSGSLTDLSKKEKHKTSLSSVAHSVGGSLLSLGSGEKRKHIKKIAKSLGSKMHLRGKKKGPEFDDDSANSIGSVGSLKTRNDSFGQFKSKQTKDDADPGVVSEDEDEFMFDELSHKSSASSISQTASQTTQELSPIENRTPPVKPRRTDLKPTDEWETKLFGKQNKGFLKPNGNDTLNRRSWDSTKLETQIEEESVEVPTLKEISSQKKSPESIVKKDEGKFSLLKNFRKDKIEAEKPINSTRERIIIGGESEPRVYSSTVSSELMQKFDGKSREDLILMVTNLQGDLDSNKKKLKDLEDYLDDLLLRVMETTPRILQNPYVTCKMAHRKNYT